MSFQVSVNLSPNDKINSKIVRPTANYHPSIWGDQFLHYNSGGDLEFTQKRVEELKEVVRKELFTEAAYEYDVSNKLKLIDVVQRLGLSYHFEREIEKELQHIFDTNQNHNDEALTITSLRFRLLRQHGFKVSCDTFAKFKDCNGNFEERLIADIHGMLSFYEASHLRVHGEEILDEALIFTTTHLESVATQKTHPLSAEIARALKRPLRKSLERLVAKDFISIYESEASHNPALLELAKLDFNLLQCLHKKELSQIVRWWKDVDFSHKLPFARDRIVELYFWILGVYYEPQYSLARSFTVKVIALASTADDIYDLYGTFEELKLLTEAVERWDVKCMDTFPEYYMKVYFEVLLNTYQEIEEELVEEESYRVHYAKEEMKKLLQAYLDEARWLNQGHFPSLEDYLHVALTSSGYPTMIATSLVGMGNIVTKEVFEWLFKYPKIVGAAAIIARYMDDIASHKFEQERAHVASSVECYMKQYGVSEQEACDQLNKEVVNAWKDINQEFLRPTAVPSSILIRGLNFARVIDLLYKDDDGYTNVGKGTKDGIAALLIDSVPL